MALSKIWTVQKFYREAASEIGMKNDVAYIHRFNYINRIQAKIADQFYGFMAQSYITAAVLVVDVVGSVMTTGTGTFTVATRVVSITNLSVSFASTDVGKMVMLWDSSYNVYVGFIEEYLTATTVRITGYNIPTSDITIAGFGMAATSPSDTVVSIATLPVMRTGAQVRMTLESTATKDVRPVAFDKFLLWATSAPQNANAIAYCFSGDDLLLRRGDSLTTWATLTVRYPRIPISVVQDSDYVDLPDGVMIAIAKIMLQQILITEYGGKEENWTQKLGAVVGDALRGFGVKMESQEISEKVKALT